MSIWKTLTKLFFFSRFQWWATVPSLHPVIMGLLGIIYSPDFISLCFFFFLHLSVFEISCSFIKSSSFQLQHLKTNWMFNIILPEMPLSPSQLSETGGATSFPPVPEDLLCELVYENRVKTKLVFVTLVFLWTLHLRTLCFLYSLGARCKRGSRYADGETRTALSRYHQGG